MAAGQFCYHEHCGFAEYASWTARPSARMRGGILISKQIQKDNENGENGVLLEEFKALVTQIVISVWPWSEMLFQ